MGGMAEIYKAKTYGAEGFEKLLAIKRILPHAAADKEFISMLIDEAKLSVMLSHANIVQVYDLGKVLDDYFISMEYISGDNFRDIMYRLREQEQPFSHELAVFIISEVCKGLDYAHRKTDSNGSPLGIVHRDISPQNILISYEGEVKIVDFGIAKAAMNISHTMAGILKGKIAYMSPEQALGKSVDYRTDIFSVGIMLYEALTGKKLFTGESQFEVLKKIRSMKIDLNQLPNTIPIALKEILVKALAYKAEDRYQSAGDMQLALTKYLYTTYIDFSPQKVAAFVRQLFKEELKEQEKRRKVDAHTVSIKMEVELAQEDIVHRTDGSAKRKPLSGEPQSGETEEEGRELTEETRETPFSKSQSSRSRQKSISKKRKRFPLWIPVTLIFAAGLSFALYNFLPRSLFEKSAAVVQPTSPPAAPVITPPKEILPPPESPKITGSVNLISEPAGAAVLLNGKATGQQTPTVLEELELNKDYQISLLKPGYQEHAETVRLNSQTPQQLTAVLEKIASPPVKAEPVAPPPEPVVGSATIKSNPKGAKIFLDNRNTGKTTPATLENLKQGTYKIRLEKEGFKNKASRLEITSSSPVKVQESLEEIIAKEPPPSKPKPTPAAPPSAAPPKEIATPEKPAPVPPPSYEGGAPATIKLASNPGGAEVFINAEYKGTTPITLKVSPGRVSILVNKEGRARFSQTVDVRPGESVNLTDIKLGDLYGQISINSTPPRADVMLDGQRLGAKTPVTIRNVRRDKSHSLRLEIDGFKPWERNFDMENSNDKKFDVLFERE